MFTRRTRGPGVTSPAPGPTLPVYAAVVATAAPDTLARNRERSLRNQIGHALQGQSAGVVGYDRGDPANSITAPITVQPTVAAAQARVSYADAQRFTDQAQVYDLGTNDPEMNAYNAALLARIAR